MIQNERNEVCMCVFCFLFFYGGVAAVECSSESPDLNPIKILKCCGGLKQAAHAKIPSNIAQMKEFCMEKSGSNSPSRHQRLVDNLNIRNGSAKGINICYRSQGCTYFSVCFVVVHLK